MTTNNRPVSLHPDSFTADFPDLSKFTLEEVVSRFKDVEKKRTVNTEPESEAEAHWAVRSAPVELSSSLKVVSARMGISRNVLTKCMSRQVVDWYSNALGIEKLMNDYNDIYSKIKLKSYTTLRIQAEHPARFCYACQPEPVNISISTIRWVLGKLGEVREVIGVYAQDLLLSGMCWSLTTLENKDWDRSNIEKFFVPEADNIRTLISDRIIDIVGLQEKYKNREKGTH